MKLFQIEEPDGSPVDGDGAGRGGRHRALDGEGDGRVAIAVGGNAELLASAEDERRIALTRLDDATALGWVMLALRERAEKALARPVTHAVVALDGASPGDTIAAAAAVAGLMLLAVVDGDAVASLAPGAAAADAAVLGAAICAEEAAPPSAS